MLNKIKVKFIQGIRNGLFWTTFFSPEIVAISLGHRWLGIIMEAIKLVFCCWWLATPVEKRRKFGAAPFMVWGDMWIIVAMVVNVGVNDDARNPNGWIVFITLGGWLLYGIFFGVSKGVINEFACRVCQRNVKVHPEIPYCKKCLEVSLNKTLALKKEVEERIEIAEKLGIWRQIEGAKRWFGENIPEPIKWILANLIVRESMLESGKTIEKVGLTPFNPEGFEKFSIDNDRTDLNIPSEGLNILAKILPVKDENKNLERR